MAVEARGAQDGRGLEGAPARPQPPVSDARTRPAAAAGRTAAEGQPDALGALTVLGAGWQRPREGGEAAGAGRRPARRVGVACVAVARQDHRVDAQRGSRVGGQPAADLADGGRLHAAQPHLALAAGCPLQGPRGLGAAEGGRRLGEGPGGRALAQHEARDRRAHVGGHGGGHGAGPPRQAQSRDELRGPPRATRRGNRRPGDGQAGRPAQVRASPRRRARHRVGQHPGERPVVAYAVARYLAAHWRPLGGVLLRSSSARGMHLRCL
mmetsp:Transcript_141631/g.440295  ORF Transcript_141631/g.440295 Transcript_141631/m.440295 type:complete len:267 (+) Transcript_141631:2087-2887(+)